MRSSVNSAGKTFVYDYANHGMNWVQGLCADHERASPVNFDVLDTEPDGEMSYTYQVVKSSFEFINNGLTFSADFAGLGYGGIYYEGNWYNLLNVNFHALSEHTFGGIHYPLEMHFIHKRWDTDDMVIVAVPVTSHNTTRDGHHAELHPYSETVAAHAHRNVLLTGHHDAAGDAAAAGNPHSMTTAEMIQEQAGQEQAKRLDPMGLVAQKPRPWNSIPQYRPPNPKEEFFNMQLQHFLKAPLPIINAKSIAIVNEMDPLDLNAFMQGGVFLEYAGSLTSPPCATNVMWFVRRDPVLASATQVDMLSERIFEFTADFGNYRYTLPLNGRAVGTRLAVESQPPPQHKDQGIPMETLPSTSRDFMAVKYAKDAFKLSKVTSDYVYSMDTRMQKAARAHADAIAPDLGVAAATPAPRVQPKEMSPVDMTKTAAIMAKQISESAKDAIHLATEEIFKEAVMAAHEAAKEAAIVAGKEIVIPTAEPPPGAPGGAPLAAPGPAPGAAPVMPPAPTAAEVAETESKSKGKGKGKGKAKAK